MQDEQIPDFIRFYMDQLDDKGYRDFVSLAKAYQDEVHTFQTYGYPNQQRNLHMGNKFFGERKKLKPEDTLQTIKVDYEEKALQLAKQNGYKAQDNRKASDNKPLDRDNLKEQYKQQIQDALQQGRRKGRGRSL